MPKFLIIIFGVLLFSCENEVKRHPGISLSFDDRSINEWFELRTLFNENKVRVTFFITQPDSLDSIEIHQLKLLQKDGHEIGFHGNMHVYSEYYIKEHSYADYLNKEINQGKHMMDSLGFNCVSFAYPYGSKYWLTDFLLLNKFEFLRSVSPLNKEKDLTTMDDIYYPFDDNHTFSALGFDVNSGVTTEIIDLAIERSINNQEVLLLYAHIPTYDKHAVGYSFDIDLLRYIIQQANKKEIGFYPIRDLKKI